LHEDDPRTAVELLRFIYGLGYDQSHTDSMGMMQFLAATYVTAAKYQLVALQDKTKDDMRRFATMDMICSWEPDKIDDFLAATEVVCCWYNPRGQDERVDGRLLLLEPPFPDR
jgi:hypothetical protein